MTDTDFNSTFDSDHPFHARPGVRERHRLHPELLRAATRHHRHPCR